MASQPAEFSEAIEQLVKGSPVHANVSQEFIFITADRLKLNLIAHKEVLDSKQAWAVPLAIVIPIALTLATVDTYKSFLKVPGNVWEALFIFAGVVSVAWLIRDVYRALRSDVANIDTFINRLKPPPPAQH
jgi:hypothetical protein